jgi:hypothetical protein
MAWIRHPVAWYLFLWDARTVRVGAKTLCYFDRGSGWIFYSLRSIVDSFFSKK